MNYELSDPSWVAKQKRETVPAVVISPESGESLVDLAIRIIRASVELSPLPRELGLMDPQADDVLITDEDLRQVKAQVETGRIHIDYWKGRPVKLFLSIKDGLINLSLNAWADRYEINETNTIPEEAVVNLGEVLAQSSAKADT